MPLRILTLRLAGLLVCLAAVLPAYGVNLTIATLDNGHMLQMQELASAFEKTHPDIRLRWVTLNEHQYRQFVSADIRSKGGHFDIVTVGMYEVPIWARRGWLVPIRPVDSDDIDDLLTNVRAGLSYEGKLHALPIYGESSMLMYRKDLLVKAQLKMPPKPTWNEIAAFAARLDDPANHVHGICLRGSPGWGENMALVSTMVNAFGGQWFDMAWQPQLDSKPWKDAVELYVKLLTRYGPKDAATRGYNENLKLFLAGKCAMWIDATVAAGFVSDRRLSKWANSVGYAQAPTAVTAKGSHWLWAWALAIPAGLTADREAAAQAFVSWATSRDYVKLVASKKGWGSVPSGTRKSTYANTDFQRAAPWAGIELEAIRTADPKDATLPQSPYVGIQFANIPEFHFIGDTVGQLIASALTGQMSVDKALAKSQYAAKRQMFLGGYPQAPPVRPVPGPK